MSLNTRIKTIDLINSKQSFETRREVDTGFLPRLERLRDCNLERCVRVLSFGVSVPRILVCMYQVSKILAKYSDFSLNSVFASK